MSSIFDKDTIILGDIIDSEAEFIPLISSETEEEHNAADLPDILPILAVRNSVLFPGIVIPITVGRDKSQELISDAEKGDKILGVVAQKNASTEDPKVEELYLQGTVAKIIKVLQMPEGNSTVIIQGQKRFQVKEMLETTPYFKASIEIVHDELEETKSKEFEALVSSIKDLGLQVIKLSPHIPDEAAIAIKNIDNSKFLVNLVASNLNIEIKEKQKLLEVSSVWDRANRVLELLSIELQMLELKNQIQDKVKVDIDKQQRDYMLNQQLKTIQDELGGNPLEQEIHDLREKGDEKDWPENVAETFEKELGKLQRMNPSAAEYSIQLNYLHVLVDLPWNKITEDQFELDHAQKILDDDHYGLEKVKERIIEHLAILKLKGDMKSPILCFVGPPGVGKTSLGKSIAKALGREYIRMSLGGVRDEAEIRGHRKTYIGAMPGRIIQNLKKAGSSNPVFVLDEIDKIIGANVSGDPSSALLEVLDPEQNIAFYDNFIEVDYDLSKVMFIATANTLSTIHPALRDRMEVIDISGYLLEEKVEIAKRHLIPKQLGENGIKANQLKFPKKIIQRIADDYTRESGVRTLEKQIAKILRNRARFLVTNQDYNKSLTVDDLKDILGAPRYHREALADNSVAGVVTGLAWTSVGGDILFIEVSLSKGKGILTLTGNLGDVMKESATLAYEYIKSHAQDYDIDSEVFTKWNVHVHVPEGATPKDGPSAGVTMITALASAFTQRKVKKNIAMTGEITLRGKVLPVGGIKEKILAAKRYHINQILLPAENRKDIDEIPEQYIKGLEFTYVNDMSEVLEFALLGTKVPKAKVL